MRIIAGPCTIESEEHIRTTATFLSQFPNLMLKGGAYKPLTWGPGHRKAHQRYVGKSAVQWLAEAGRVHSLPTVSECLYPETAPLMANSVTRLQIGSRNMQNFPLLERINETRAPVLLKRHYGASLDDLYAATTYLTACDVWVCERGITVPHRHGCRFVLDLQAVPVWHRRHPSLPIYVDVSHGCFDRSYVADMARGAAAVGADGLLLDVHPDPSNAWVDPETALTFTRFEHLMRDLL